MTYAQGQSKDDLLQDVLSMLIYMHVVAGVGKDEACRGEDLPFLDASTLSEFAKFPLYAIFQKTSSLRCR
jgi:hypothetical protein